MPQFVSTALHWCQQESSSSQESGLLCLDSRFRDFLSWPDRSGITLRSQMSRVLRMYTSITYYSSYLLRVSHFSAFSVQLLLIFQIRSESVPPSEWLLFSSRTYKRVSLNTLRSNKKYYRRPLVFCESFFFLFELSCACKVRLGAETCFHSSTGSHRNCNRWPNKIRFET